METPAFAPDDLATPRVIADPYPAYRALRPHSPVRYVRAPAQPGRAELSSWALLRHDQVTAALRDPNTFSSARVPEAFPLIPRLTLLHADPPRHTQLRRVVNRAFAPRRVAELLPFIQQGVDELLDAMGGGTVELMRALSVPLPMRVIATLLGTPHSMWETFRRWSESSYAYMGLTPEERTRRAREMIEHFTQEIATRREQPKDDLISALVRAEIEGEALSVPEAVGFCVTLLVAGNETTTNLIGNMMHILAERPALWQKAREDRSLVERILDETLRFESPVQRLLRVATRDVTVGDVTIKAGEMVDVAYGAANRDPAVFEDPDTFRVDRPAAEHVAFGSGIHYCLGAPLARAEASIALNAMLDRFESVSLADQPAVRQAGGPMALGYTSLPLVLRPRV
jgi:hypothetical protein